MATATLAPLLFPPGHAATADARCQAALDRLERGTFGLCVGCDRPIEKRRIEADPLVERCAACARSVADHAKIDA
jgi:RNA polymerase-binding transcription factor DksA